jgi:hypothetical protein
MPDFSGPHDVIRQQKEDRAPVEVPKGPAKPDTGAIRKSIAAMARSFVKEAHYLEATAGCTPGGSDGNPGGAKQSTCKLLPATLDTDLRVREPRKVLSVHTAMEFEVA